MTVHRALSGNPHVSAQTRREIFDAAREMGYPITPSPRLNREPWRLAVLLPGNCPDNYYFDYMWQAIDELEPEFRDRGFLFERYYMENLGDNRIKIQYTELLEQLAAGPLPDGMILWVRDFDTALLGRFYPKIPVVTVTTDVQESLRLCGVGVDFYRMGLLAGELMSQLIDRPGKVLCLGATRSMPDHQRCTDGFLESMRLSSHPCEIIHLYSSDATLAATERTVEDFLTHFEDLTGIYTRSASSTRMIQELVGRLPGPRRCKIIGSDVFLESADALLAGRIDAVLHKNPYGQAKRACRLLADYLAFGRVPPSRTWVDIDIVLKNSLHGGKYTFT